MKLDDRWLWFSMLFAAGLSLLFYSGYLASDDGSYLPIIKGLANGQRYSPSLGSERLALLLPAVPIAWLTNGSNFAIISSYLIYFPLAVYLSYRLGLLLHDQATARLCAFITATCPLFFAYAGAIFPDVALAVWVSAALLASLRVLKGQGGLGASMLAGLCVGLAYSTKQTGLLMAVPCGLAVVMAPPRVWSAPSLKNGAAFLGTLILALGVEQLLLRMVTGEWVDRSKFLFTPEMIRHFLEEMEKQGTLPWERLAYAWKTLDKGLGAYRYAFLLAVPVYCLAFRGRAHLLVGFTTVWLFSYMTLGSVSLSRYLGGAILARYYVVCIPTAALMLAAVLLHFAKRMHGFAPRRMAAALPFLCVVLLSVHAYKRHSQLLSLSCSTRAFADTYVIARRQHSALPLFVSKFVHDKWYPLFPDQAAFAFFPTVILPRDTSAEELGTDPFGREFLLMRQGTEWVAELANDRGPSSHLLKLDRPGVAPLIVDPANYEIERLYFSGDETRALGYLTLLRTWFLRNLDASPISVTHDPHAAWIFLERWRRVGHTPGRVVFAERDCRSECLESEPPLQNRRLVLDAQAGHARLKLSSPRLPKAPGVLQLEIPIGLHGGPIRYRVSLETRNSGGQVQRADVSGSVDVSRTIVISQDHTAAVWFAVELEFWLGDDARPATLHLGALQLRRPD